jgi:uncharacterized protein (DUF58 family)
MEAASCAGFLRLGLNQKAWKGSQGNWAGAGIGSSIDFQDHRPYLPGDDPRYIDWAAYARSGQTIMKLYREEVSPCVDLLIDGSASMILTEAKRDQFLRLIYFCIESAMALGTALKVYHVRGEQVELIPIEKLIHGDGELAPPLAEDPVPDFTRVQMRAGSLRIVISDLLFRESPARLFQFLAERNGKGMVFAPFLESEVNPDWTGNMELIDCEQGVSRRQRVDAGLLKRYREAYGRHMESWQDAARRYQIQLARVPCGLSLAEALKSEALAVGAVETWG